jgi:hypothetical protein
MNKKPKFPTSKQIHTLYYSIGESVSKIQILEDALSHSMAMKKVGPGSKNRAKGDEVVKNYRRLTLGQAINQSACENIYPENLQKDLKDFLPERNWLIHKCLPENIDNFEKGIGAILLLQRIQAVGQRAFKLQQAIEDDMLDYASLQGRDMTRVRTVIAEHHKKVPSS